MPKPLLPISTKKAYLFACFLVLYELLTYLANDMIMPGMLDVVRAFQGDESAVASSLSAYVLGGASLQLFLGPLSDAYGRKPVMLFGTVLFFVCTALIACSTSIEFFLIARFFQGMGLCFIAVIGYATIQELFAEMDAIRLIAIMANVSILAPLLGPLLGALIISFVSWRWIFVVIGLLALVALIGIKRFMPETVGKVKCDGSRIDPVPLRPRRVFNNFKTLCCNPSFLFGALALGVLGLPCLVWIGLSPVLLVTESKLSVIQYGLWQIPLFGACIIGSTLLRSLTHSRPLKQLIFIGSLVSVASLFLVMLLPWLAHSNDYLWLIPGIMGYFFGLGLTSAPLDRYILFSTSVSKGTVSALLSLTIMVIQGVGVEIGNMIYSTHQIFLLGSYFAGLGLLYCLLMIIADRSLIQSQP